MMSAARSAVWAARRRRQARVSMIFVRFAYDENTFAAPSLERAFQWAWMLAEPDEEWSVTDETGVFECYEGGWSVRVVTNVTADTVSSDMLHPKHEQSDAQE